MILRVTSSLNTNLYLNLSSSNLCCVSTLTSWHFSWSSGSRTCKCCDWNGSWCTRFRKTLHTVGFATRSFALARVVDFLGVHFCGTWIVSPVSSSPFLALSFFQGTDRQCLHIVSLGAQFSSNRVRTCQMWS